MYASHKKDINRHKSFHPLTGRNLGKVEQRKEKEEAKKLMDAERNNQLRHDQEQRRYDDLILSSATNGVGTQLAKFRQVENIFAAEGRLATGHSGKCKSDASAVDSALKCSTLSFKKENKIEGDNLDGGKCTSGAGSRKRERGEEERSDDNAVVTGYLSTSAAAQMRRELDALQKSRHDPLRRVEKYQNRTVAAEAKRRELEGKSEKVEDVEKNNVRDRIQQLLAMRKGK